MADHAAAYRPVAPPRSTRHLAELRQAMRLPHTLFRIFAIAREDFATAALDEYLWAFWGFHQQPSDLHYRARPWQQVQLRAIEPREVVGIAVWEMAMLSHIAMENEEPILEYTHQSGEGFRFLLPTLGRFMGTNAEQARYAAEHRLTWCEGAWCAEERRHSNTLARIIERLTKTSPRRDNPNVPMIVTADEQAAVLHLVSRQTTEWNASSSYVVMAAHATGHLHTLIRNLARDEIKHLAIMSAADRYLFGPRRWKRFVVLIKKGLENFTQQRKRRSGGDVLGSNPITALEGAAAHLLTEFLLRKWLDTVPLRTLTTVFETPSSLQELAAFAPSPERQAAIDAELERGRAKRVALARWAPDERERALAQREFERVCEHDVSATISTELDGFRGAEAPGSAAAAGKLKQIRRRRFRGGAWMQAVLRDRMRDFQIRNNCHTRWRAGQMQAG